LRAAQTDPSKMRSRRQPGSRRDAAVQRCRDGLAGGAPTPRINATGQRRCFGGFQCDRRV